MSKRFWVYSQSNIFSNAVGMFIGIIIGISLAISCSDSGDVPDPNTILCDGQKLGSIKKLACAADEVGEIKQVCSVKNKTIGQWVEYSRTCKKKDPDPDPDPCNKPGGCPDPDPDPDPCPILPPEERITTYVDIEDIFADNCLSCHKTQKPTLDTYAKVKGEIDEIIKHTKAGAKDHMPPSGQLSDADLALIAKFKADGMLQDSGPDPKPDPKPCPDPDPDPDPDPNPDSGVDQDGIKRIYKPTGKEVKLEYGARHENGDRYNANHAFTQYEVTGYYLTAGTEKIEMKTDGPNHSGCSSQPKCMWAEPQFVMASGKAMLGAEYPHPDNHDKSCTTCKTPGGSHNNKWIGYKVIAYTNKDGFRTYEQWVDLGLTGDKPGNKWQMVMQEVDTGQILPGSKDRKLPIDGRGLEAEIRCHGGHKTEMKYGKIVEIVAPK